MKKIIVCGASKNLGNYILKKFSITNKVYNLSRTNTKNKNFLRTDFTNYASVVQSLKKLKKQEKKIDAFIFCIGDSKKNYKSFPNRLSIEDSLKKNFFCFVNLIDAYLEVFKKTSTNIIVISSIAGTKNIEGAPISYSLSKNILNFYSKIVSKILIKNKIKLNIISPGNILMEKNNWALKIKKNKNKTLKYIKKNVPSEKFCSPDEIYILCKLIIENQHNLVGSNIVIDGGQTL